MLFSSVLLAAPALVSAAAFSAAGTSFTLNQVASDVKVSATQQMAHAMLRHGRSASPAVIEAMTKALITTNVTGKNHDNEFYTVPVTIGTQKFHLDFTTGTSDLQVYSSFMPASERALNPKHHYYAPGPSASLLPNLSWNFTFGPGVSAAGTVYADSVSLGSATAPHQAVQAATSVSSFASIASLPFAGTIGLGFRRGSTIRPHAQRPKTFFESIAGGLKKPLFTVSMRKDAPGSFDFGFIDKNKYTGNISYVPLNANGTKYGTWEVDAGEFQIGGESDREPLGDTIVDSGTTQIFVADRLVRQFFADVKGASFNATLNMWMVPCDAALPSFEVALGLTTVEFGGENLVLAALGKGGKRCYSGLQSRESIGAPVNIFGMAFLNRAFVVFDHRLAAPRVGFALRK